jgi:hypothetical protein
MDRKEVVVYYEKRSHVPILKEAKFDEPTPLCRGSVESESALRFPEVRCQFGLRKSAVSVDFNQRIAPSPHNGRPRSSQTGGQHIVAACLQQDPSRGGDGRGMDGTVRRLGQPIALIC